MVIINSLPDDFVREIRDIGIFRASDISFNSVFKKEKQDVEPIILIQDINPNSFDRRIKRKKLDDNYLYKIDLSVDLFKCDSKDVDKWNQLLNAGYFAIRLISNHEMTSLGNKREPLTIDVIDLRKEDDSGNDKISLSIHGKTILEPSVCPL